MYDDTTVSRTKDVVAVALRNCSRFQTSRQWRASYAALMREAGRLEVPELAHSN